MASSAARLARLHNFVQSDLAALPHRPLPEPQALSDDDASGGVALGPPGKQPAPSPVADSASVQTLPITPNTPQKSISDEDTERRFVWKQGAASSYNLGSQPKLSALPTIKLAPTDLKRGELAQQKYFTPITALAKYPYQFCNKSCMQDIASGFFDAGKFWAREWDLYYVWDIEETKPLLLVSETQFEHLLNEINSALKLGLRITNQQREDGLVSRFPDHPRCHPRYLGRTHSKDEYDTMASNVPGATSQMAGESVAPPLEGRTLEDFKQMIEEMWELTKNKGKAAKEKKKMERLAKQKGFADQFKRAQRYLGLRPSAQTSQPSTVPSPIDTSLPAPFPFDRSVVFVCVDVESYEKAHHKITEIGVATLDTRDLSGVAPGPNGENWRSKIRARHFRIQDNAHLVNSQFVAGCPDRFDFGQSEWSRLDEAPARVADCFKPPFAARSDQNAYKTLTSDPNALEPGEQRNLIFLGHDTLSDVKYLQNLGFDPLTLPNILEAQDTATMYRVWQREQNPTKLGNILYDLDIAGFNLHNAGNDAVFTVQAMLGICMREATIRGSPESKHMRNEQKATRLAQAQAEAKQHAEDYAAGWSDNEADGDGGAPEPIIIQATLKPPLAGQASGFNPNSDGVGRGRGRTGSNVRGRPANSNDGNQNQDTFNGASPRGGYRHLGAPLSPGRARGQGRGRGGGRGRARGSADSRPVDGFDTSGSQVRYHW